jgi:hypothetical protein
MPYDDWLLANKVAERYDRKVAGAHWVIYYPRGQTKYNGEMTDNGVIAEELAQRMHAVSGVAVPRSVQEVVDTLGSEAGDLESLQWKIELVSATTNASTAIIDRQKYLDTLKTRAYRFPERAILEGVFGTKAEAEAHADLAITGLDTRHIGLTDQVNRDLVNQTLRLNYGPGYDDKVFLKAAPLTDEAKAFLREIFKGMLADPNIAAGMDVGALQEKLKIPVLKQVAVGQYDIDPMTGLPIDPMQAQQYQAEEYPLALPDEVPLPFAASRLERLGISLGFNPNQPRDASGRFGEGGSKDQSKSKSRGEKNKYITPPKKDTTHEDEQAAAVTVEDFEPVKTMAGWKSSGKTPDGKSVEYGKHKPVGRSGSTHYYLKVEDKTKKFNLGAGPDALGKFRSAIEKLGIPFKLLQKS